LAVIIRFRTRGMCVMFQNKIVEKVFVPPREPNIHWSLYWLKAVSYDAELHSYSLNTQPHFHSFFEIHIVRKGFLRYMVDSSEVTVRDGEYIMFPPKMRHQLVGHSTEFDKYVVAFSFSVEDTDFPELNETAFLKKSFFVGKNAASLMTPLHNILFDIDFSWKESPQLMRLQLNAFLLTVSHDVQQCLEIKEDEVLLSGDINDEQIYRHVVQYLTEHVDQMVGIEKMAAILMISDRQINRILRRSHATSFRNLRDEIKCAVARELLAGNLSMEQIGERIGFQSEYSFNRFFKRVEGMPPGKFREALRCSNCK